MMNAEMVVETEGAACIEDECTSFCIEEGFLEGKCIDITCFCSSRSTLLNKHRTDSGQNPTYL